MKPPSPAHLIGDHTGYPRKAPERGDGSVAEGRMSDKRMGHRRRRRCIVKVEGHPWFTTDMSAGGFGVVASGLPRPGTKVSGLIQGKTVVVPFSGLVVWAQRGNTRLFQRSRAGVKFIRVDPTIARLYDEQGIVETELDPGSAPLVPRRAPA